MSLLVNTRNALWLQVHKTLSDSKCGRNANKNAQATADEDALGQFAQQIDEIISYQNKQPRFLIIQFDEIEEPVTTGAMIVFPHDAVCAL